MEQTWDFIYKKECWYVSAFLNAKKLNGEQKAKEIQTLLQTSWQNLNLDDLKRIKGPQAVALKEAVLEISKNSTLECKWVAYMAHFPYQDENTGVEYDTLGYFQIDVEYFPNDPVKKQLVKPGMIQQLPILALGKLSGFERMEENQYLNIDTESPIYVFVMADKTTGEPISWSQENINRHKRVLGNWIEIYSGSWPDYSDSLYDMRIQSNLSNRLSELHFIRRNSGFIFMVEENYRNFFDSYMRQFVLEPTPRIRAMLHALISINHSLDLLFIKRYTEEFLGLDVIENKLTNLRLLRGMIQTNLSVIYDELDYNRRQHYTAVLNHLIQEFQLDRIITRINEKFAVLVDSLQELYQKKSEETQEKTERGLGMLNLLFGLGVIADFATMLTSLVAAVGNRDMLAASIYGGVSLLISVVLVITMIIFWKIKAESKQTNIAHTVDAVILDGLGQVVLYKREYPPFQGFYALPGSFVRKGEDEQDALIRTIAEKTHAQVKVDRKIGVYAAPGRDPRGNVISHAYLCRLIENDHPLIAERVSRAKLKECKLAFDHKKILSDAGVAGV